MHAAWFCRSSQEVSKTIYLFLIEYIAVGYLHVENHEFADVYIYKILDARTMLLYCKLHILSI